MSKTTKGYSSIRSLATSQTASSPPHPIRTLQHHPPLSTISYSSFLPSFHLISTNPPIQHLPNLHQSSNRLPSYTSSPHPLTEPHPISSHHHIPHHTHHPPKQYPHMKSATAHDPGVSHRVHDTPPSAAAVYPTRIRKSKRRNMSTGPSSRGRTRAADLKERSSRRSPNSQSLDTTPSSTAKDDNTSAKPVSDARQAKESNPKNPSDSASQEPRQSQRNAQRNEKFDKQRNSHSNASASASPPSTPPSAKTTPCALDDLRLFAKHLLETSSTSLSQLFPSPQSAWPEGLANKSQTELKSLLEILKAPFDSGEVSFAPVCGPAELAAAVFSQMAYLTHQTKEHNAANAKYAKIRNDRERIEKNIEKLENENWFLSQQIDKERERRERVTEEMHARQSDLRVTRSKLKVEVADTVSLRNALQKAKANDLDARRRLDRTRLKVAALRGEMITSTVDRIITSDQMAMELEVNTASIDNDPLHHALGGSPSNQRPVLRPHLGLNGSDEVILECTGLNNIKSEDLEYDEDAEETQLRLLRNRLAMCETEATEWRKSLESEQTAVILLTKAKARLEEDLARAKQPNNKVTAGGARGTGKGNGGGRMTAKLRVQARIGVAPGVDGTARKSIKKSRKGRPRRSLDPC